MTFYPNPPIAPLDQTLSGWSVQFFGDPVYAYATYNLAASTLTIGYVDETIDIYEGVPRGVGQVLPTVSKAANFIASLNGFLLATTQIVGDYMAGATLVDFASPLGFYYGDSLSISLDDGTQFVATVSAPPSGPDTAGILTPGFPSFASSGNLVSDLSFVAPSPTGSLQTETGAFIFTESGQPLYVE